MYRSFRACALGAVLVLAGFLPAAPVSAQEISAQETPPEVIRLDDVLAQVAADNPMLRAARLGADALALRREQAEALPDPMAGVTYLPLPLYTARGRQRTQWRVEQTIPYPGKRRLQGEIAGLTADVAAHETEAATADLLLQAKRAYYDLYRIQRIEALVRDFQDELQGFEQAAAAQYEVGRGGQQAILKAQLERHQLAQRLIDLGQQRRSAAEALARLTNRPEGARAYDAVVVAPPPLPDADAEGLFAVALQERPEEAALAAAAERAAREVELAEKQFYPDLALNLTYFDLAPADVPMTATGRDALAVGAMVRVPLQRGRLRAQVEEARLRQAEVEARREALHAEVRTQIQDLRYAIEQDAETLRLYDQTLLPQAASTAEAALSAYTTGRAGFLDLLDAQRTLFALRTGYADVEARYLQTAARLERAAGLASLTQVPAR